MLRRTDGRPNSFFLSGHSIRTTIDRPRLLAHVQYSTVEHQSLFESCSFATDHLDGIDQFNPLGFTEWEQASSSLALRKSGGRGRMRDRVTVWYASLCEIGTMSLHW